MLHCAAHPQNWELGPRWAGKSRWKMQKKILGKALSRWGCAAHGGVAPSTCVSEGTAKMQLQRDLQGLAGGAAWSPSQRVDTKVLELLWSHQPGLGHLNCWAHGLRTLGAGKVQVLSFSNVMCCFLTWKDCGCEDIMRNRARISRARAFQRANGYSWDAPVIVKFCRMLI